MNRIVLDASAVLALLQDEPGSVRVKKVIGQSCLSAVNYSEVVAKLNDAGVPQFETVEALDLLDLEIVPFDRGQGALAGELRLITKEFGLSLGDRACLALAIQRDGRVLTTDREWAKLKLKIKIEILRG